MSTYTIPVSENASAKASKKNNGEVMPDVVEVARPESREEQLFRALGGVGAQSRISKNAILSTLVQAGLRMDDIRLKDVMEGLSSLSEDTLNLEQFSEIMHPNIALVEAVVAGDLVIPDFMPFCTQINEIYELSLSNRSGAIADYIPQLGRVDPEQFGVSLCTVDGQRFSVGDSSTEFCIQSCCKPLNYALALEENGEQKVHEHIGCEPSGHSFNELTLDKKGKPHNPLINSGAIMACSLIKNKMQMADRFDHVSEMWSRLAGGKKPTFDNPTYLSERGSADRNFAIGYFMREHGAFPEGTNLIETLEFYFQCCSLEMTAESMSVVAGTLANGGICPITGERVFAAETVQRCLSLMYSCGMYDFSGEWAFSIGLPAKSGVAGAIVVVVPNVLGLCTFSPRLDTLGNSVRGIDFCRELTGRFNFHNYDNLTSGVEGKTDPRRSKNQSQFDATYSLCWAAAAGDLVSIRRQVARGSDLGMPDYDGRTPLHIAASDGQYEVVSYLIAQRVAVNPKDRWGGSPMDDAIREGHDDVVRLLRENGGVANMKA